MVSTRLVIVASAIVALGSANQAAAKSAGAATNGMNPTPDNVASMMYQGSQNQVKWAKMAQEMSQNPGVKQYAEAVQHDHEQLMTQLQQMSKTSKINLNSMPSDKASKEAMNMEKDMTDMLKAAPPGQFDNAYLATQVMVQDHHLAKMKGVEQAMQGSTPPKGNDQAKWAAMAPIMTQAMPTMEQNRQKAYQLLGTVGPNMAQGNNGMGYMPPQGQGSARTGNPAPQK